MLVQIDALVQGCVQTLRDFLKRSTGTSQLNGMYISQKPDRFGMATVLVRHKVNDYAKWKAVLDETKPWAKSNGVRGQRILRNSADPNEVVVVNEFADMSTAQKFAESEELKQVMQRAGVAEAPSVWFLNEADNFTL